MSDTFLCEQIAATKSLITVYTDALAALGANGVQSYTMDTGQDRTTVTKLDIKDLNDTLDGLLNRLSVLESRCTGSGVVVVAPAW